MCMRKIISLQFLLKGLRDKTHFIFCKFKLYNLFYATSCTDRYFGLKLKRAKPISSILEILYHPFYFLLFYAHKFIDVLLQKKNSKLLVDE